MCREKLIRVDYLACAKPNIAAIALHKTSETARIHGIKRMGLE